MLLSESLSDVYFRKTPRTKKEYIKASKISGTENESISQFNETDNENVRRIVYDWFTSVCVDTEEYKRKYTEDENKDAHDIILSLISMGLG
jgi:hypothetical protein